ncbi:hypothetical protein niasHT_023360 [Heterodera trifolii]|uniref:Zinc metalloproteinase n=1 Tax=Heterodera trifolii TaxID=157864 RepID=A0ABD2JYG4_9BILA
MDSEEVKKHNEEKEKVKKLLAEYKRKVNKEMEKHVKEMEKDEKLKEVLREIEEAQAKHPGEKRKAAKSITEINAKHWDELYQGDIVLNVEQAQYLLDTVTKTEENRALKRMKRGAITNAREFPNHKWSMLVPFSFDSTISSQMKAYIYEAIKLWNDNTCLSIVEDDDVSPRIQFTNPVDGGCKSSVGMQSSEAYQKVTLEYPNCYQLGSIAHEIGHALGFFHEHERYDRDSFVWFYPDNVDPANHYQFKKETTDSTDNYRVPYDLGSVMHYNAKAFSINGQYTLVPRAGASYINTIGQQLFPNISDYIVVNKHYCGLEFLPDGSTINTEACHVTMNCDNDGFQNPDTCSTCICPQGYIGAKCQDVDIGGYAPAGISNTCEGNILFATSNWQYINGQIGSHYFDSKIDYSYCHWQIFPDIGQIILIEVLDVGQVCVVGCTRGNTEIRTAENRGNTGIRLCCRTDLGSSGKLTITATNGYALISLYSFYNIQRFHIRFRQY